MIINIKITIIYFVLYPIKQLIVKMNWSLVLFIVIGAIPNILKKKLLDKLTIPEYFISFSICMAFLTFSLFCYKTYVKKEKFN